MADQKILGLIAGNGKFPIILAKNANQKKIKIIAVGVKGDTSRFVKSFAYKFAWVGPGELKKIFSFFKKHNVREIIMAGQVNPENLFNEKVPVDEEFQKLFSAMKDRKADTIFTAVAERLKAEGLELLDSTSLLKDYLAPKGTLTKRGPTETELSDIEFGIDLAKKMGGLDVGQTVVIKEKAIVAVEAMEGTDRAITRGGHIARRGAVIIKMSKPLQDNRFDVPVVGPRTIEVMTKCRASCLAVEAGKTIIIDQTKFLKMANKKRICVVGA